MRVALLLLALSYPMLVFFGLELFEPRWIALALGLVALVRCGFARRALRGATPALVASAVLAFVGLLACAVGLNDETYLRFLPALISLALLAVFATSLIGPMSMVEVLARAQVSELSGDETRYCRRVTWIWCAFFVFNAGTIVALSLQARRDLWALYTGLLSYALIGLLFAAEFVYRHWRFRRYVGWPTDAILRRIFPPPSAG